MAELSVQIDSRILHKVKDELSNLYAVIDAYQAIQAIDIKVLEADRSHIFWREVITSLTGLFVKI